MTRSGVPPQVHDDAGCATAEEGIVMLDGPNGVAVSMTPSAARRTGEGLVAAARVAEEQIADS